MGFWCTVIANSIVSLLAVLLGVPVALWVNRLVLSCTRKEQRKWLLESLRKNLEENLEFIGLISEQYRNTNQLNAGNANFLNVRTSFLESTASFKYEVIDNIKLNVDLDNVTYDLGQLNRALDLQLEVAFRTPSPLTQAHSSVILALKNALDILEKSIPSVLSQIKGEQKKLGVF